MLWFVLLPFQLIFFIIIGIVALPLAIVLAPLALVLWVPFLLVKLAFRVLAWVLMLPLLLVGGVLVLGVTVVAAAPMLLLLGLGFIAWRALRSQRAVPV